MFRRCSAACFAEISPLEAPDRVHPADAVVPGFDARRRADRRRILARQALEYPHNRAGGLLARCPARDRHRRRLSAATAVPSGREQFLVAQLARHPASPATDRPRGQACSPKGSCRRGPARRGVGLRAAAPCIRRRDRRHRLALPSPARCPTCSTACKAWGLLEQLAHPGAGQQRLLVAAYLKYRRLVRGTPGAWRSLAISIMPTSSSTAAALKYQAHLSDVHAWAIFTVSGLEFGRSGLRGNEACGGCSPSSTRCMCASRRRRVRAAT